MKYYSTRNVNEFYTFKDVLITGLAKDGGLFVPELFPKINFDSEITFKEIAFEVSRNFIDDDITNSQLADFIDKIFYFSPEINSLDKNFHILELFHGPTLAFKDFGARFMAEFMSYYSVKESRELTVLVATSGDTGSAVASAFFKKPGINVVILYPSKMVSEIQEKQLTTFGENISALEIQGTFDDCQRLAKEMFLDSEVKNKLKLTSANSINAARLLPQTFYYLYSMISSDKENSLFVVPSGNLGNLTAGLYANKILSKKFKFLAALNSNNVFQDYLYTGKIISRKVNPTISNAMDVGNPSNLERINSLFFQNLELINSEIESFSVADEQTEEAISECYAKYNYILDPHSAVGFSAIAQLNSLMKYDSVILLETAHPSKFIDVVERNISSKIEIPERLQQILSKQKNSQILSNKTEDLKEFLLNN